jgi:hypothetical protein
MAFETIVNPSEFLGLTDDLKSIVYDNLTNPKDILNLCASHKACDDFKQRATEALYTENMTTVEKILNMFQKDCFYHIESDLKNDETMRQRHFSLFINGYQGTNAIQNADDFEFYDEECELVRTHCNCTFNKLRYIDVYEFNKEENALLKQRAMDYFFDMTEDYELIDNITLKFQSGIEMKIECCRIDEDDHYISVSIDDENNNKLEVRKYELGQNCKDTSWVADVMSAYKKLVQPGKVVGNLVSVDYECMSGHMWRFAYFRLERLPIYHTLFESERKSPKASIL